jgi:hypothetical protein
MSEPSVHRSVVLARKKSVSLSAIAQCTLHLIPMDARNDLVCGECYIANPPLVDVDIIFAQVIAQMIDEA